VVSVRKMPPDERRCRHFRPDGSRCKSWAVKHPDGEGKCFFHVVGPEGQAEMRRRSHVSQRANLDGMRQPDCPHCGRPMPTRRKKRSAAAVVRPD
jgi:hypothetical protein